VERKKNGHTTKVTVAQAFKFFTPFFYTTKNGGFQKLCYKRCIFSTYPFKNVFWGLKCLKMVVFMIKNKQSGNLPLNRTDSFSCLAQA